MVIFIMLPKMRKRKYQLFCCASLPDYNLILDGEKTGNNKWLRYCLFTKIVSHIKSLMRRITP